MLPNLQSSSGKKNDENECILQQITHYSNDLEKNSSFIDFFNFEFDSAETIMNKFSDSSLLDPRFYQNDHASEFCPLDFQNLNIKQFEDTEIPDDDRK